MMWVDLIVVDPNVLIAFNERTQLGRIHCHWFVMSICHLLTSPSRIVGTILLYLRRLVYLFSTVYVYAVSLCAIVVSLCELSICDCIHSYRIYWFDNFTFQLLTKLYNTKETHLNSLRVSVESFNWTNFHLSFALKFELQNIIDWLWAMNKSHYHIDYYSIIEWAMKSILKSWAIRQFDTTLVLLWSSFAGNHNLGNLFMVERAIIEVIRL